MRVFITILGGLFSLNFLVACGPGDSTLDLQDEQDQIEYQEKVAQIRPAIGIYYGTLSKNSGDKSVWRIRLEVFQITLTPPNTGKNQVSPIPALAARLYRLRGTDYSDNNPITSFDSGDFNPRTGLLTLVRSSNVASNYGNITATLSNGQLTGEAYLGNAWTVNLKRQE